MGLGMSSSAADFLISIVNEHHAKLVAEINELISVLSGEDPTAKLKRGQSALSCAAILSSIVTNKFQPTWLRALTVELERFVARAISSAALMSALISLVPQMRQQVWVFDSAADVIDFDAIYDEFKKNSRLPELLDQIVKILERLRDSGEVDSASMLKAIGRLISTLRTARDGSYFSLRIAWNVFTAFVKNYVWLELGKLPVLGTAVEALKQTIDEVDAEMERVQTNISNQIAATVEKDFRLKKEEIQDIPIYGAQGRLLTRSSTETIDIEA